MFNRLKARIRAQAFRRTIRAIKRAQKDSWYLGELLRTMLKGELQMPDLILPLDEGFGGGASIGK